MQHALNRHHPYTVRTIVSVGICALTALTVFVPELYSHLVVLSAQLGVNLLWVWGDEL